MLRGVATPRADGSELTVIHSRMSSCVSVSYFSFAVRTSVGDNTHAELHILFGHNEWIQLFSLCDDNEFFFGRTVWLWCHFY